MFKLGQSCLLLRSLLVIFSKTYLKMLLPSFEGVLVRLHQLFLRDMSYSHLLVETNPQTIVLLCHGAKDALRLVEHSECKLMIVHLYVPFAFAKEDLSVSS